MKLLLDTHIWLWSLLEPSRLCRRVAAALVSRSHEKWLSPISIWETLMLADAAVSYSIPIRSRGSAASSSACRCGRHP